MLINNSSFVWLITMCSHNISVFGCKVKDFFVTVKTFNTFFFSSNTISFIYIKFKGVKTHPKLGVFLQKGTVRHLDINYPAGHRV